MAYTYNQEITYIDGTYDPNFDAAQLWAKEHGVSFKEDVSKQEPYNEPYEELYLNEETGEKEIVVSYTPTIKRYFYIGSEKDGVESMKKNKRMERNTILRSLDFTRLDDAPITPEDKARYQEYRVYLRDFTKQDNWWTLPIKPFELF